MSKIHKLKIDGMCEVREELVVLARVGQVVYPVELSNTWDSGYLGVMSRKQQDNLVGVWRDVDAGAKNLESLNEMCKEE